MQTEFVEQVKKSISEQIDGIHTALPGKIVKFDKDKCEAEIMPYGKLEKPDGTFIDYPKINEVTVMFPQGSWRNASIVFPIKSGDECLLIISEYTLDTWRRTGEESSNDLKFDLTNAICLPGMFSKPPRTLADVDKSNAMIIDIQYRRDDNADGQRDDKLQTEQRVTLSPGGIKMESSFDIDTKKTATIVEMRKKFVGINTDDGIMTVTSGDVNIVTSGSVNIAVKGGVHIKGNVDVEGTIDATDDITSAQTIRRDVVEFSGGYGRDGNINIRGWIEAEDYIHTDTYLDVVGNATIGGDTAVSSNVTVGGNIDTVRDINTDSDLNVKGNASIDGDLTVTGNIDGAKDLNIAGDVQIDGDTIVEKELTVNEKLFIKETEVDIEKINGDIDKIISDIADIITKLEEQTDTDSGD
ncbi:hypothetical protein FACS1894105_09770 [Clostridia bacterium]|nr:hypothetical protein FACS1894105_09770 [Clostridia bacterium]